MHYDCNDTYDGHCANCNGDTFVVDYERGDSVCCACGCVETSRLMVVQNTYKQNFDYAGYRRHDVPPQESMVVGAYFEDVRDRLVQQTAGKSNSAPYRRATYFAERISQWRLQEPPIVADDLQTIFQAYDAKYTDRYVMSKDDCRTLLWEIDARLKAYKLVPRFVKRYLVSCALMSAQSFSKHGKHFGVQLHSQLYA